MTAYVFFPWLTRKAIHRQGFGCTLLDPEEDHPLAPLVDPKNPTYDHSEAVWPMGETLNQSAIDAVKSRVQMEPIEAAIQTLMQERPYNIRALLVLYKGQIIAESYAEGFQ